MVYDIELYNYISKIDAFQVFGLDNLDNCIGYYLELQERLTSIIAEGSMFYVLAVTSHYKSVFQINKKYS